MLRWLEVSQEVKTLTGQHIDYIIPVVSNPSFVPALEQAEFSFNLTDHVEELLDGGAGGQTITITVSSESGESIYYECKLSDILMGGSDNKYTVVLNGLTKGTRYRVSVSGDLRGEPKELVQFKDQTGQNALFEFMTLDEIEITIPRSRIINEYYHYKMLEVIYNVDSITGVQFRYDIYDTTDESKPERVLSYESLIKLKNGETDPLGQADPTNPKRKRFYEREMMQLNNNYLRLDLAPPEGLEEFTPGHTYQVKVAAYPVGTDYTKSGFENECVGEQWSQKLVYPLLVPPANQISVLQDAEKRTMTITPMMQDTSYIAVSEGFIQLDEAGVPVKGTNGDAYKVISSSGTEIPIQSATGGYIIQIMEAIYAPDDTEHKNPIQWTKLPFENENCEQAEVLNTHCIHGMVVITLKGLNANWDYKIQMFTILDKELDGKEEIKPLPDSEMYSDGEEGVTMLTEYTQRTVGENGVLLDKSQIDFEQVDSEHVLMTIYNALGTSQIKNMQATFMPKDSSDPEASVGTGIIPVTEGQNMKTSQIGNGVGTKTEITIPASIKLTGTYAAIVSLHGEDTTAAPLLKISPTEG